jgi:prevent-host-death family protein
MKTHKLKGSRTGSSKRSGPLSKFRGWKLEEAKARFSEVVRLAREKGPQRVTVYGKDAVVVVSAEEFLRLFPMAEQPSLHTLLSSSPLKDLEFEFEGVQGPVRDVPL